MRAAQLWLQMGAGCGPAASPTQHQGWQSRAEPAGPPALDLRRAKQRPRAAAAPGTNRLPQEKPAHPGAPELVLRDPETWSPREFHLQPLRRGTTSKG